jgi:single-strand DNA-binding protein
MNVLTIVGNLGQDATVDEKNGSTVANFSVAMKSGYGDKAQTIWVSCSLWGKQAESKLVDYLTKGQSVAISGEMGTSEYKGKTSITMNVKLISLTGKKNDSLTQSEPVKQASKTTLADIDSDIPF